MGLFGKAIRAATGIEGLERTLASVRAEVAAAAAGEEVEVGFGPEDVGRFNEPGQVARRVVEALEEDGHEVLETVGPDAEDNVSLRVRRG